MRFRLKRKTVLKKDLLEILLAFAAVELDEELLLPLGGLEKALQKVDLRVKEQVACKVCACVLKPSSQFVGAGQNVMMETPQLVFQRAGPIVVVVVWWGDSRSLRRVRRTTRIKFSR